MVVSAGNDAFTGYQSLWGSNLVETSSVSTGTLGMPGTFDSVLTVASAENSLEFSQYGASNILSWRTAMENVCQWSTWMRRERRMASA